jgi:hypothetical protein
MQMIKRTYFMHSKVNKTDGKGGYLFSTNLLTLSTILSNPEQAFAAMRESAVKTAEKHGFNGSNVEVTYFGRC